MRLKMKFYLYIKSKHREHALAYNSTTDIQILVDHWKCISKALLTLIVLSSL